MLRKTTMWKSALIVLAAVVGCTTTVQAMPRSDGRGGGKGDADRTVRHKRQITKTDCSIKDLSKCEQKGKKYQKQLEDVAKTMGENGRAMGRGIR